MPANDYNENNAQNKKSRIFHSIIAYAVALFLLYLSVFISQHVEYNGSFISALPFVLPMVLALIPMGFSVMFILGRESPWFFTTGTMSLVAGITLMAFGVMAYHIKAIPTVWAGATGLGLVFIVFGIIRLIIQGGLNEYRKYGG